MNTRNDHLSNAADHIEADLRWLAQAWTDLTEQLGRPISAAGGERVSGSRDHGILINEQVSAVMAEVRATIVLLFAAVGFENYVSTDVPK